MSEKQEARAGRQAGPAIRKRELATTRRHAANKRQRRAHSPADPCCQSPGASGCPCRPLSPAAPAGLSTAAPPAQRQPEHNRDDAMSLKARA